jgi:hypothetical protein
VVSISAPVPDSAAASHRTCGNAPSRLSLPGPPNTLRLSLLSGRSELDPSIETTRSPHTHTPGVSRAPIGPATSSNSKRITSGPSLRRPRDRLEIFGGCHRRPTPASTHRAGSTVPVSSRPCARPRW